LAIEGGDARDGHLGLIESEGGEGFSDLESDEGGVDLSVGDDAHVRSTSCLSYLVFDDLPVPTEG
jgi:hypothetical protein